MASGKGSNFATLLKCTEKNIINAKVCALITNNSDSGAFKIAKDNQIRTYLLNHKNYNTREELDYKIIENLSKYSLDLILMAGWMRIVTNILIDKYKNRIINIHPSLLPSFKGFDAIQQALDAKVKITGCTYHIVVPDVDSGKILAQAAVPINSIDNHHSLKERIQAAEHKLLPYAISIAGNAIREG